MPSARGAEAAASPRHIVITGASRGLGAALAIAYARDDVSLTLIARDAAKLDIVALDCRSAGATVETALFDVSNGDVLAAWLQHLDQRKPVDLVIANAGISAGIRDGRSPEGLEQTVRLFKVNLIGVANTVEPLLPGMIARGRGQIAMIASVAGLRGLPYSPAYAASKAGVRSWGDGLRALLAPSGIDVSVILPGFFVSDMSDRFKGPQMFRITAAETARRIQRGLARRQGRIVTGQVTGLLLRLCDLLPARAGDAILRRNRFSIDPE